MTKGETDDPQLIDKRERIKTPPAFDASHIKQPDWSHVFGAFIDGAREARANADAKIDDFKRAADAYAKRLFIEIDPASDAALHGEQTAAGGNERINDLVRRLRGYSIKDDLGWAIQQPIIEEAADEIERMQRQIDRLHADFLPYDDQEP